jgi:hypothetical protein
MDLSRLAEPFPAADVEWRMMQCGKGKDGKPWGKCLAYLTNRAIQSRLDEVCGQENWHDEYQVLDGGRILCGISIRINGEWVTKWDGATETVGHTDDPSMPFKGGLSNAEKRTAVKWGIGRYLYSLAEAWVVVTERSVVNAQYAKTKEGDVFYWVPPPLPGWALPGTNGKATPPPAAQKTPVKSQPAGPDDDIPKSELLRAHINAVVKAKANRAKFPSYNDGLTDCWILATEMGVNEFAEINKLTDESFARVKSMISSATTHDWAGFRSTLKQHVLDFPTDFPRGERGAWSAVLLLARHAKFEPEQMPRLLMVENEELYQQWYESIRHHTEPVTEVELGEPALAS